MARLGSARSAKLRAQFLLEHDLGPDVDVPKDLREEWGAYLFSRAMILDAKWKAAPGVPYDPSQGERIYRDPELADLKTTIAQRASGDWTAQALAQEAALGNLRPHLTGSTSAGT